jgi:Protein of unknown function (DUF3237)
MQNNLIADCELIYEADIRFTGTVEYGTSMQDLTTGKVAMPLAGARFDQTFVGVLRGPKLYGEIAGIDYLFVRPDGLFQLNLHARICTQDHVNIAFSSTGVSLPSDREDITRIRAAAFLFTTHENYLWVNKLQLWAAGSLNIGEGTALIKAYSL